MNNDAELLKIRTKNDGIQDSKYKTEKHDNEKILKSFEYDNEYYKKKYRSLNKKKVMLFITEFLIGSGSIKTLSLINPSVGNIITSSTALLTSIALSITKEDISKLKKRYTKPRDWISLFTIL